MAKVTIYSKDWCPFCKRAKQLLASKGTRFKNIDIEAKPELRAEMVSLSGRQTVPQIFINNRHIGGCDDLFALESQGELEPLLNS
ncbi:glutaredoxin 3 [Catenovulum sp. SM1970]|uniref:glutaredoxin 3 n=1 Tax=Marinifaba aquimaris TaxID=2741323 RepID=UPI001574EB10|nr:glutaredoxin 3 [Marinifaba aquimaris]NTS77230.1 glutaredoxin 3 [Marinifaba aquimaris]